MPPGSGQFMAIAADLPDRRVLVASGHAGGSRVDAPVSFIYDPVADGWTAGPNMPCIGLDQIVADDAGVAVGTPSLPSSVYNQQNGLSVLADGRLVHSGSVTNEVVGGFWGQFSARTYVFDPAANWPSPTCVPSHL
jgi:hypothetical protein